MLYFDGLGSLIFVALWIFCFIDVLLTPEGSCRNLPKLAWVFIVLLAPFIGAIAWLVAGRDWTGQGASGNASMGRGAVKRYPEYDRPGRFVPSNPDDDEEFLAGLRKRADEQRQRAKEQRARESDPGDTDTP